MKVIDFLELFNESTQVVLLDPYDAEIYSGDARRCKAWLMKNSQYDIFPENGGTWAKVDNDALIIFLDAIVED